MKEDPLSHELLRAPRNVAEHRASEKSLTEPWAFLGLLLVHMLIVNLSLAPAAIHSGNPMPHKVARFEPDKYLA